MSDRSDALAEAPAPFVSSVMRVEPQWIDYNGHLNMAYYHVLFDRAVDNQVSRLRRKVEVDSRNPQLIQTVWGGGYMLAADVRRVPA